MAERAKIQLTNLFDPREDVTMYIKGRKSGQRYAGAD